MSPIRTSLSLHDSEVLWPEMKSKEEVVNLKMTTLPEVWETTYQGSANSSLGSKIFDMDWFHSRYTPARPSGAVGRWISIDTGLTDTENAAYSSAVVGDLMPDYSLRIVYCWAEKLQFPGLVDKIISIAREFNDDKMLRGIIIENKSSGISAIQSLQRSAERWIVDALIAYNPKVSKETRWGESAIWCSLGCVHLPAPGVEIPWLYSLENDLRDAPDVTYKDRLDSFAQLIIFLSNLLSEGYRVRQGVQ